MRSNSYNDYLGNPNIRLESGYLQPKDGMPAYGVRHISVDLNGDEEEEEAEEEGCSNDNSNVHIDTNCDF